MIRRITRIDDAGLFKAWRPDTSMPEFERINVIYGSNGSGKSSLARLLQNAAGSTTAPAGVELLIDDAHGGTRKVSKRDDAFWQLVRVFNKEYVDRTLRFDRDGKSDAAPLLVLGEQQIDRESQLRAAQERLDQINEELGELEPSCARSEANRRKMATSTAKQIVEELQVVGGRYEGRKYSATQVQQALAPDQVTFEGKSIDVAADLKLVQGRPLNPVAPPRSDPLSLAVVEQTVTNLLVQTVTSRAIDELRENPDAAGWVQRGLELHEHRSDCLFCGGPVTAERRQQIEAHFDESVRTLQRDLARAEKLIEELRRSASVLVASLPSGDLLYPELQDGFAAAAETLRDEWARYQDRLDVSATALKRKGDAIFSAAEPPEWSGPSDLSIGGVVDVISHHNERSAAFTTTLEAAARRVELSRLAAVAPDYDNLTSEIAETQISVAALKAERRDLQTEHSRLNAQRLDPGPLADELTRDVAVLLGRSELTFELRDDRYVIERNGSPALGLSEGEKTAISLLYFLCSLREESIVGQEAVVVIDDPVSSLDQDVLVGVSGHIWSALVAHDCKHQVFLLTHSFELFRMWSNQLDRLKPPYSLSCTNMIAELRVRWRSAGTVAPTRRPTLIPWTDKKLRKSLRSQYHYLFWRVGSTVIDGHDGPDLLAQLEATAIIPNAARKMLEAFLAFRYPGSIGDFEASMRRALEVVPDATKHRVTRFLHHHSHNEEADLGRSVDSGEAVSVLMSVFELIREVDRKHYTEMCWSLALDQAALVGSSD